MRRFFFSLSAAAVLSQVAAADDITPASGIGGRLGRPLVAPLYCPPVLPCVPLGTVPGTVMPLPGMGTTLPGTVDPNVPGTMPGAPGTPGGAVPPGQAQPDTAQTPDSLSDPFARPSEAGTLTARTFSANNFGDILGARSIRIGYSVPITARFGLAGRGGTGTGGAAVTVDPNATGSNIQFGPTPNGTTRTVNATFSSRDLSYTQPLIAGTAQFDRAFARSALQTLLSNGELTAEQIQSFQQLSAADRAKLLANRGAINQAVTQATRGLGVPEPNVTSVDGSIDPNFAAITYTALLSGESVLALPGSSSSVGRIKTSEDNSPIPRDRLIFTYDSFGDVPFTAAGMSVNRFQFGIEKTFRDGLWSAEFRLPFAGTLASTYTQGAEVKDIELGNLRFTLKHLLIRRERLYLSAGLSVTLPTADDQVVNSLFLGELFRFRNESVQVEPWVGALFTPNDRLFIQGWGGINFDTSGGDITWNRDVFGGSGSARFWDLPLLWVDTQVGYWVYQRDSGAVRGIAPFVELHWNHLIAQDRLNREIGNRTGGQGLSVTTTGGTEFNILGGVMCQLANNLNLAIGAGAPLLKQPDRTFNWQFGIRLSYLYGRTAQQANANRAYSISGY
jgi:hypothetical protein